MEGHLPIFFMLVALKIPAIGMIWLLYWASHQDSEANPVDEGSDDEGRKRPRPSRPRGPRRGPHGGGAVRARPSRDRSPQPSASRRNRGGSRSGEPARLRENEPSRP